MLDRSFVYRSGNESYINVVPTLEVGQRLDKLRISPFPHIGSVLHDVRVSQKGEVGVMLTKVNSPPSERTHFVFNDETYPLNAYLV